MIKLVVFDWNGTIISDTQASVIGTGKVFSKLGLGKMTLKRHQDTFDIPVVNFYKANGLSEEQFWQNVDLIFETFHEAYEEAAKHCRTRAGTKKLLKWLKENDVESVILSNHRVEAIERQLKRLNIERFFDVVLANEDKKTALKDKGKKLGDYFKKRHFKNREMVVVGDGPEEMKLARQFGAKSVGITGGFFSTGRLKKAKPDYLIHNMGELVGIVRELSGEATR